ncbi:hypothetical protein GYMLUDRAFT_65705 [Collybiopsis luxurians FD-317 M1]|nr:hypothetical protein GYMLUDRAFT_65705 [Collybiopsis luxurians FD-317 M1]
MSACVFTYISDCHSRQVTPARAQDMQAVLSTNHEDAVEPHTDDGILYDAQDSGWSGSEGSESYVHLDIAQSTHESVSGDYCQAYNQASYPQPFTNSTLSAVHSPSATHYPQLTPQFEIQPEASSSSSFFMPTSSSYFAHTIARESTYYDDSLSYPHIVEDHPATISPRDDMAPCDAESYYDDGDLPESWWKPETSEQSASYAFLQPTSTGWFNHAATIETVQLEHWTKKTQHVHAQPPLTATFYRDWYEGNYIQDPNNGYYPCYPNATAGSSYYSAHLSDDMRNTPSDFTSSESPLSPLEYEACPGSSVSSTVSPDALAPPPTPPSSLIIHAPRPTRTIDSAHFQRLIAASDVSS